MLSKLDNPMLLKLYTKILGILFCSKILYGRFLSRCMSVISSCTFCRAQPGDPSEFLNPPIKFSHILLTSPRSCSIFHQVGKTKTVFKHGAFSVCENDFQSVGLQPSDLIISFSNSESKCKMSELIGY